MFFINPRNIKLGVMNTQVALITGIHIPPDDLPDVAELREAALARALGYTSEFLLNNPVIIGYQNIYRRLGYIHDEIKPAAQNLVELIWKRKSFPKINVAVDVYNSVVIENLVGIGAHDLSKIRFPILFTSSDGREQFQALGSRKPKVVPQGDFLYKDANDLVLAHMAADDCETAKLSFSTENILMVIEGNLNTSVSLTHDTLEKACKLVTSYCGGSFTITEPRVQSKTTE